MGFRTVYGYDPLQTAYLAVTDPAEKERKRLAQRRVDLLFQNTDGILTERISKLFKDPAVRARILGFVPMAAATAVFCRTINEIAGPAYQVSPTRKVLAGEGREPDKEQTKRYRDLARITRLDFKLDLACHIGLACNSVFVHHRYNDRLGHLLDVLTPAQVSVITDPEDTQRELAIIYEKEYRKPDGQTECSYVYWDDEETFAFSKHGMRLTASTPHTLGRLPFVPIHMTERPCGQYWDTTTGHALEAGDEAAMLLMALTLKLHKSAGFKQPIVIGDIVAFPKGQAFDEENAIVAPEGTRMETLDLTSPAEHYLATLRDLVQRVSANNGINLDRLNAKAGAESSDLGLQERREDAIKIFRWAEEECFEVRRLYSRYTPGLALDDDARVSVDFGEMSLRTDPAGTLELWKSKISMGLRNELDNVRALNPEIDSDEEAWEEYQRNLDIHAEAVDRMRKLNMGSDASPDMPGQDARQNGAMGPMVRDGEMTADEAAMMADKANMMAKHDDSDES